MFDDGRPLFQQIAEHIESAIIAGTYPEETQVPSSNELAAFHQINPATAAKGLNELVAQNVLYKKRGIGMFVTAGAPRQLREQRRAQFASQYVAPLVAEASKLGVGIAELKEMLDNWGEINGTHT